MSVRLTNPDIRACRELLRHLGHPRRLRDNPIVLRMFGAADRDNVPFSDAALVAYVTELVESSMAKLPPRQQAIVRRCDIGGERYADAARSLFISERHAFRERDAAVASIFGHLVAARPAARRSVVEPSDRFWLQIANAQALDHNGSWQAAAAVLERLRSQVADADRRCFVETRLARVCAQSGHVARAEAHLASAFRLAADAPGRLGWQDAEVGVTAAWLAVGRGDSCAADQFLRRCCAEIEAWSQTTNERRVHNALIEGLTLRAELAGGRGDLKTSASFASKAREAVRDVRFLDPEVVISARTTSAVIDFFCGRSAHNTRADLEQCYTLATNAGLTREALVIATHLAGCMRHSQRAAEAVQLLTPLVPAARTVVVSGSAAAFFCELVSSNLESQETSTAASYLTELQGCSPIHPLAKASVDLVSAKTHLARHNYAAAFHAAEAAENRFRRLDQERVVGTSLRLQAEALAELGERERALTTIKRAIEALSGRSHPTRLAAAYRVLALLSGEAKYAATARRLLSSVDRSA